MQVSRLSSPSAPRPRSFPERASRAEVFSPCAEVDPLADWKKARALFDCEQPGYEVSPEERQEWGRWLGEDLAQDLLERVPPQRRELVESQLSQAESAPAAATQNLELLDSLRERHCRWAYPSIRAIVGENGRHAEPGEISELSRRMAADPEIDWESNEGCWARAHLVSYELDQLGINYGKLIVAGDLEHEGKPWVYHMGALVRVDTPKGPAYRVIDPAVGREPMAPEAWISELWEGGSGLKIRIEDGLQYDRGVREETPFELIERARREARPPS